VFPVAEVIRGPAGELDHPLQGRQKGAEVICRPGLTPDLDALGRRPRPLGDELRGQLAVPVEIPAHHAEQRSLIGRGIAAAAGGFGGSEQRFGGGRGKHLVRKTRDRGQLFGARLRPAGRHHGLLIPVQHGGR